MTEDFRIFLARRIEEVRRALPKRPTLREISKRSGITYSTVQRISKGEVDTSASNIEALAKGLGVSIDEFMSGGELMPDPPNLSGLIATIRRSSGDGSLNDSAIEHLQGLVDAMSKKP